MTAGWPPSITATTEFVVPRSIPIILLIVMIPPPIPSGRIPAGPPGRLTFSTTPLSDMSVTLSTCAYRFLAGFLASLARSLLGSAPIPAPPSRSPPPPTFPPPNPTSEAAFTNPIPAIQFVSYSPPAALSPSKSPMVHPMTSFFLPMRPLSIDLLPIAKIFPDTVHVYAAGKLGSPLAVIARATSLNDLTARSVRLVAMANPRIAPYGFGRRAGARHPEILGQPSPEDRVWRKCPAGASNVR